MNKKGFAVSVILYSIVFLIITTLLMLLAIMRTRYNVNSKLRDNIRENINDKVEAGSIFASSESCTILYNTNNYTDNLVLTISVNKGNLYSWDNENYSNNNKVTVNRAGTYTGYFKDTAGGSGSCSQNIISKTQYSYRDCSEINYGQWYGEEEYVTTCPELITEEEAVSGNLDTYNTCNSTNISNCPASSTTCYKLITYKRNVVGCKTWGTWSQWADDYKESSLTRQTRFVTMYKIK